MISAPQIAAARTDPPQPEEPAEQQDTDADPILAAAIADALKQAQGAPLSQGGGLSGSEIDDLRLSVEACWNLGRLSSAAMRISVTLAFDMNRDGTPVIGSIRRIDPDRSSAAQQAFEAARAAIIRCGREGYDLPIEKYADWRQIELTFNPEQMRQR